MSSELARREPRALPQALNAMPTSWADVERLGTVLAQSGFFTDSRQAAQAITKVMAGLELGIPPIAAMTGIHIVKGKVTLGAQLIASQIRRSPRYDYRLARPLTNEACEIEFLDLQGAEPAVMGTSRFTIDDAKKAGLVRPDSPWHGHARNMLFARAMSNGAKWFCPDIWAGPVYTPDELGAQVDYATGEVVELPAEGMPPAGGEPDAPANPGVPRSPAVTGSSAGAAFEPLETGVEAYRRLCRESGIPNPRGKALDRVGAVLRAHGLDGKADLDRLTDRATYARVAASVRAQFAPVRAFTTSTAAHEPATYQVTTASDDDPTEFYGTVLSADGMHSCSCRHGQTRSKGERAACHHVDEALVWLRRDARQDPASAREFADVLLGLDPPTVDEPLSEEQAAAELAELRSDG